MQKLNFSRNAGFDDIRLATAIPELELKINHRKHTMGVEIYVGQISGTVTEDEIIKLFSVAGTVASVHLVTDPGTGQYRGCGYVRMSTEDEAREAIDLLNGAMLGDRLIVVKNAPPKNSKKKVPFGGSRVGQGRQTGRGTPTGKK